MSIETVIMRCLALSKERVPLHLPSNFILYFWGEILRSWVPVCVAVITSPCCHRLLAHPWQKRQTFMTYISSNWDGLPFTPTLLHSSLRFRPRFPCWPSWRHRTPTCTKPVLTWLTFINFTQGLELCCLIFNISGAVRAKYGISTIILSPLEPQLYQFLAMSTTVRPGMWPDPSGHMPYPRVAPFVLQGLMLRCLIT